MENQSIAQTEEKNAPYVPGMVMLIVLIVLAVLAAFLIANGAPKYVDETFVGGNVVLVLLAVACWVAISFVAMSLRILKPNEAYVLTIFGKYYGSIKHAGFFSVNPFAIPTKLRSKESGYTITSSGVTTWKPAQRRISMKAMTLNNEKQKINDLLGNPIEIGIVVIWRVVNTAKAIFNVDDFNEFLSTQCDSALRNIVRMYPYDIQCDPAFGSVIRIHAQDPNGAHGEEDELSLRGSSKEIANQLRTEIQEKVDIAGLEVMEARITHLAYSPEIAAAMLQRQQAQAIIDARRLIVKGAVSMVEQALSDLNENDIVDLDNERKAAMVSNLLVVLCGNKEAQPIVNSGSLY